MICADTSFLFSLYAHDQHSRSAVNWLSRCTAPLTITPFNEFELGNAFRFAEFRGLISAGVAATYCAAVDAAIAHGRLARPVCNLASILAEAQRFSATHTLRHGHRGFDILHVAAALTLGATKFLTFDSNQKRLAEAEGLTLARR